MDSHILTMKINGVYLNSLPEHGGSKASTLLNAAAQIAIPTRAVFIFTASERESRVTDVSAGEILHFYPTGYSPSSPFRNRACCLHNCPCVLNPRFGNRARTCCREKQLCERNTRAESTRHSFRTSQSRNIDAYSTNTLGTPRTAEVFATYFRSPDRTSPSLTRSARHSLTHSHAAFRTAESLQKMKVSTTRKTMALRSICMIINASVFHTVLGGGIAGIENHRINR